MDTISIAFATAIPINVLLFLHHMYYSYKHIANETEKIYYYLTAIIPLAPAVMYSFKIITYLTRPESPYADLLDVFFITWVISNPLLLINLGKVVNISLRQYFVLVACDLFMYIIGFLAYRTTDPRVFVTAMIISGVMFCVILGTIIYLYFVKEHPDDHSNMLPIYKILSKFIIVTWIAYPSVFLAFKMDSINILECALTFVGLDFLTKSVFSSIIIVYHRHLHRRNSLLDYTRRKTIRVIPLESIVESPVVSDENAGK